MHPAEMFELIIGMLVAIVTLHVLASRLHWPPSIALLVGGGALAFLPGIPTVHIDPQLVLVLFLPPLLMDGAWDTEMVHFRRHFAGILSLAVGAVLFTTLIVAAVAHWLMPALPWAACAALGAIVAPPDAVSAAAVLKQVKLPRRLATLLEGESLLNDAAGIVLFRFAVAAAMGEAFNPGAALGRFALLAVGGIGVGLVYGRLWIAIARRLRDELTLVTSLALLCWLTYLTAEMLQVSGVIAAVTVGLVLGWHQHVVLSAAVRIRGASFWSVLTFVLEASVFILIGFSLREVLERAGGLSAVLEHMAVPVLIIVLAMTVARFAWLLGSNVILRLIAALGLTREKPLDRGSTVVMGWAGMRGVVTLAVALSLPESIPGRDFMLLAAFGVILVTVLIQGSTLGLVIRWTGVRQTAADAAPMGIMAAETAMMRAQLAEVERLARDDSGKIIHPRLLDQYTRRVHVAQNYTGTETERDADIAAHFNLILAAVAAGRAELVRLHRAHQIDDETLHSLERDLDLDELRAISSMG